MTAKKTFKFGALEIEAAAYGSQGSAILGIRDSGKTSTAMALAEKLMESGIPFVAFDAIGVWSSLQIPGKGRGYPVVVAGGKSGNLPLTVAGAPEIMRAAMRSGVSLVIDLFDINLTKADWKRIVTSCVKVLLHENNQHGLRHVFIEEAAEFAPQRVGPDSGHVYAVMEQLARMGGNSRLGYTLINQRGEEVSKAVLELCDNLLLHRQKGRNSLTALSKWLDVGAVKEFKAIIDTLPTLPQGECWAWMEGSDKPVHIKVPAKNSAYPNRRAVHGAGAVKSKAAVDVGSFVKQMKGSLLSIDLEAKENDPAILKKRIKELEAQLKGKSPSAAAIDIEKIRKNGYDIGFADGASQERGAHADRLKQMAHDYLGKKPLPKPFAKPSSLAWSKNPITISAPVPLKTGDKITGAHGNRLSTHIASQGTYSAPQQRVINSLIFWRDFGHEIPTREQVAVVARYKPTSGGFGNLLSELKTNGAIEYPETGRIKLLSNEPASNMDAEKAASMLRGILSAPQNKVLDAFTTDQSYTRDAIADASGYQRTSGGFGNLLSELSTLGVIEKAGTGMVKIAPWVWEILS